MVLGVSELTTKFVKIFTFAVVAVLFYKHEITVGVGVATLSYVSSFIEPIDTVLYNFTAIQSMKDVKKKVLSYTQDTHVTVLPRKKKLNSDITFENVTFKRKSFALESINLTMDGIDSVGKNIWPEFFEGIFNRKEKECQRFSGGEKQAVAFLRMAAKNAEVILLDEPFSAMDAKMKSAVEHYLFTGKEFEGKTVLVITHDTREESLSQYDGIIHVGENGIYVE